MDKSQIVLNLDTTGLNYLVKTFLCFPEAGGSHNDVRITLPLNNFLSQLKLSQQIHTFTKIEHQSLTQLIPLDMNLSIPHSYSVLFLGSALCYPPTSFLVFARRLSCYISICIPCTLCLGYCSLLGFIILQKEKPYLSNIHFMIILPSNSFLCFAVGHFP